MSDTPEVTTGELLDELDRRRLLAAILQQAISDYIKLQPRFARKKSYLEEAFQTARDVLFDESYEALYLKDEDGSPLSLKGLVSEVLDDDRVEVEQLKKHAVNEAVSFWENKYIDNIYIPDSLVIEGHVWSVLHSEEEPEIDYEHKEIRINKDISDSEHQEQFVRVAMTLVLYHQEIPLAPKLVDQLGSAWFRVLRMNGCFIGD